MSTTSAKTGMFHRFFVSYEGTYNDGRSIVKGFRTFGANSAQINFHDIEFLVEMIAEHLSKNQCAPVRKENVILLNIAYLGHQDDEAWTHNSYEEKHENPA